MDGMIDKLLSDTGKIDEGIQNKMNPIELKNLQQIAIQKKQSIFQTIHQAEQKR